MGVIGKTLHQFLIAKVKAVLEQAQRDHQAHAQARPACMADLAAADANHGAKQVWRFFNLLEGPCLVGKLRRQTRFDLLPGQALASTASG